jgi:hypothetical protein
VAAAAEKKKITEREQQPWNGKSSCAEIHGKKVAVKISIG